MGEAYNEWKDRGLRVIVFDTVPGAEKAEREDVRGGIRQGEIPLPLKNKVVGRGHQRLKPRVQRKKHIKRRTALGGKRRTLVTVQGQFVTTMTSPLVAGYSQSLKVSVVASGHRVVSSCTTTTEVTVPLKYAQVPFAMPAAAETGLMPVTMGAAEIAATVAAELVDVREPADAPRTPAAKRPTAARLLILEYISFGGWMVD